MTIECVCQCGNKVRLSKLAQVKCRKCGEVFTQCQDLHVQRIAEPKLRPWPAWALAVARFARPQDAGVGDTVRRIAAKFGGEAFKVFAKSIGVPCGCDGRQYAWNDRFPYVKKIDVTFVTSLSPKHGRSQVRALNSWHKFGVDIVSVNTKSEVDKLYREYPQVTDWVANDDEVCWGSGRRTQPVRRLVQVATDMARPIFIVNSDIEVYGDHRLLTLPNENVTLGIRWNYDQFLSSKEEFQWGFDVVGLTPEHARKVPANCTFGIGQPVWDYAVPMLMSDSFNVVHEPLFYHQIHSLNWDEKAWAEGAEIFAQWFGPISHHNTAEWRKRFEPDMIYNGKRYVRCTDCAVV